MSYEKYEEAKKKMGFYQAYIKNITKDRWLKEECAGVIELTENENERMVFYDEGDVEATLEYLNDYFSDAYVLLIEDDEKKIHNRDKLSD